MATRDNDTILLALLLLNALYYEDDPEFNEYAFRHIRDRLRQTETWDPMLDELFFRRMRNPQELRKRRASETREIAISTIEGFRKEFEPNVTGRFEKMESRLASLDKRFDTIHSQLESQTQSVRYLSDDLHSYLWFASAGADVGSIPMTRFIPVRIYLAEVPSDRELLNRIVRSIYEIAEEIGFEKADEFAEESGSWWKRLVLKTKKALTHKEVQDRLAKVERAAEVNYLDKPQAEANKAQAEGTSSLITSLNNTANACIQVGSLLLVKVTGPDGKACTVARTLSQIELKCLEENQGMLKNPDQILGWLQDTSKKQLSSGANAA